MGDKKSYHPKSAEKLRRTQNPNMENCLDTA